MAIRLDAGTTEVGMHELGKSLAATVATIQAELARYPNSLGAYLLDEIELAIPLQVRIDDLGQTLVRTTSADTPAGSTTELRFRIRPVLGASAPSPVPHQTLDALGFAPAVIAMLQARRIFSVEDLQRVGRDPGGRIALGKLQLGVTIDSVLDRADVLTSPQLPARVADAVVKLGMTSAVAFLKADPAAVATQLTKELGQEVGVEDVRRWQERIRTVTEVPLPSRPVRPGPDGGVIIERPGGGDGVLNPGSPPPRPPVRSHQGATHPSRRPVRARKQARRTP